MGANGIERKSTTKESTKEINCRELVVQCRNCHKIYNYDDLPKHAVCECGKSISKELF